MMIQSWISSVDMSEAFTICFREIFHRPDGELAVDVAERMAKERQGWGLWDFLDFGHIAK